MTTEKRHPHVPDPVVPAWKLERFLLGELQAAEMDQIHAQVEADPALALQLQGLRADNEQLLERHPAAWMAPQIERRAEQSRSHSSKVHRKLAFPARLFPRLWPLPAAIGLVAMLALVTVNDDTGDGDGIRQNSTPGIRLKGTGPRLSLHRKIGSGSEPLLAGAYGRAGDVLQIRYHAGGRLFGAILSVDGNGSVTLHLPSVGDRAQALESTGPVSLAFAYELDDAPDWERFYFVTADSAFELGRVVDAAATAAFAQRDSLLLRNSFEQFIVTLNKESAAAGGGP